MIMFSEERYTLFSIVLAANSNNPTILNPDFLKYNDVVDGSWELKQAPICTPPFSQVIYTNDVSITSQLDKIVFSANIKEKNHEKFDEIYRIARKYFNLIPHVDYTGIGINPQYIFKFVTDEKPEKFILKNFINIGVLDKELIGIGFTLKFPINKNAICNLNIDSGKLGPEDKLQDVIIVKANFHHPLKADISTKISEMNDIVDSYKADIDYFEKEIINKYFHKETK